MSGLLAYGAYLPYHRLQRKAVAAALGGRGGSGTRTVASFDEDTTSLGVEAARVALRTVVATAGPKQLFFATTAPAYLDKTNATTIHAALGLDESALAVDMVGAVRSGVGALLAASSATEPTLVVLSDIRTGLPGGADERDGGDGAAALLVGPGTPDAPVVAEILASSAATEEFLDRWRSPGDDHSRVWEERFGESVYVPLADRAFADVLKKVDLTPDQVDHLIVTGLHARAVGSFTRRAGVRADAVVDNLAKTVGNTGTAHFGLLLADTLDRAEAGQTIVVVVLADGATAVALRTTEALPARRAALSVAAQVTGGRDTLRYADFLNWRGRLTTEPPRRPDPDAYAAPPAGRNTDWKYGFTGSRCEDCGTRHLPPARVCRSCGAVDHMTPERLADTYGTVATFTIDRLAFTPSPPLVAVVVDIDGGGRFKCELTDVDPDDVAIGDRVEMTFRKVNTARGIHNYFWKARPVRAAGSTKGQEA
ncbi:OB-fold domain-containing protein [Frankia sp. Cppng1_Ct_nod]|uniref:OB-fold domain-containing protein n=1 Tax=Frankia sp. Cppng1_Ct_nod TaxID=2897162 RepID=UPI00202495E4|nr:OB-fold domain-containing protein [Frankia sp. Cppng1_Ct_nod]